LDVIASEAKQSPSDRGYIDGIASLLAMTAEFTTYRNLAAANGAMSIGAGRPETRSATIFPVIGAAVIPTWPCPNA
jgi:hypothetical protein